MFMEIVRDMISKKFLPLTILTLVTIVGTIRLGIWQLDRLEQRRNFNTRVQAQIDQPVLELDQNALSSDVGDMEYREVIVRGIYDHSQEIAVRNQHWQNQWGAHLVTPLVIDGSNQAILVDRGWIPAEDFESGKWSKYAEPGTVQVKGVIRASKQKADFGGRGDPTPSPGENARASWNFVNVEGISQQVSIPLLPAYIQQAPETNWEGPPYRSQPKLDLTEGSHQSYAIQWFTFALIAAIGYPLYLYRRNKKVRHSVNTSTISNLEGSGDQTIFS